jgi:hypothetical protein
MKYFFLTTALCGSLFADVPLNIQVTSGDVTATFRVFDPAENANSAPDSPKQLIIIYSAHSPSAEFIQAVVRYTCDGSPQALAVASSVSSLLQPGPLAQSVNLCRGHVAVKAVSIIETVSVSTSPF